MYAVRRIKKYNIEMATMDMSTTEALGLLSLLEPSRLHPESSTVLTFEVHGIALTVPLKPSLQ